MGVVVDVIAAKDYQRKEKLKTDSVIQFNSLEMLSQRIAGILGSKDVTIQNLHDTYPELFEKEIQEIEDKRKEAELMKYKQQFIDYANEHNSKMKRGGNE